MHQKSASEIIVINLQQNYVLMCALPFLYKTLTKIKLHSVHQVEDKPFVFIIKAVYTFYVTA